MLNPQLPLSREVQYLLAETAEIRDMPSSALYSVGKRHSRRDRELYRPQVNGHRPSVAVLEDVQLITRETDPFRKGRSLYRITGPLIIFYEAITAGTDAVGTRRDGWHVA